MDRWNLATALERRAYEQSSSTTGGEQRINRQPLTGRPVLIDDKVGYLCRWSAVPHRLSRRAAGSRRRDRRGRQAEGERQERHLRAGEETAPPGLASLTLLLL